MIVQVAVVIVVKSWPENVNWGPGPVNTNLRPVPVNTNWGPRPVSTNWGSGPINTNRRPGLGAKQRAGSGKYKDPWIKWSSS